MFATQNRNAYMSDNFNCRMEAKDFSRSRAVTYTVRVVRFRKRCKKDTSLFTADH